MSWDEGLLFVPPSSCTSVECQGEENLLQWVPLLFLGKGWLVLVVFQVPGMIGGTVGLSICGRCSGRGNGPEVHRCGEVLIAGGM